MNEQHDSIIITVGAKILGDHGYKHWLTNFKAAMAKEDFYYFFRLGVKPKNDEHLRFIYIVIGGRIRYRIYYAGSQGPGGKVLDNGVTTRTIYGKAWIIGAGPLECAPRTDDLKMKGFQGMRYTNQLW